MKNFVIATVSVFALLSAANAAEEKAPETMTEGKPAMEGKECPPHHKHPKHHGHKHHGHKHHGHRGSMHQHHALAVYVNYPLLDVAAFSACQQEYYQGNQAYGYIWHEGYFWYPQMHADLLVGYTPHYMHGYHWYPSRVHPHAVYVDKQSMMPHEIYPVQVGAHGGEMMMKEHRHHKHHHKGKKMHSAQGAPVAPKMHKEAVPMEKVKPASQM